MAQKLMFNFECMSDYLHSSLWCPSILGRLVLNMKRGMVIVITTSRAAEVVLPFLFSIVLRVSCDQCMC
jgi:hypothetical protein